MNTNLRPGMITELARGGAMTRLLPDFPPSIGGGFKKHGVVQKDAAAALREYLKRKKIGNPAFKLGSL